MFRKAEIFTKFVYRRTWKLLEAESQAADILHKWTKDSDADVALGHLTVGGHYLQFEFRWSKIGRGWWRNFLLSEA